MTTGLVLIVAILMLGGVIATVGDRLGMRVGKARLSLFNLRPRQTATLITILTGGVISASTLGVLFAVSDQLRTGVFELENIQEDLSSARRQLREATEQRERTEERLRNARRQQNVAQRRLEQINRSLQTAVEQQAQTEAELNNTQEQLQQIQSRFQQAQDLLQTASQQATVLQAEIEQLQADRQELVRQRDQVREQIALRDQEIADRDRAIAERDQAIANRESQLKTLEDQRFFLGREIEILDQEYKNLQQNYVNLQLEFQGLRLGTPALLRNQPLASGVVRVVDPAVAPQAVEQILRSANQFALQRIQPRTPVSEEQIIQITNNQVEQLINQIDDGQDYVVRILSAGNYVVGEPCVLAGESCVQVLATAVPNQRVFFAEETIAATPVNPQLLSREELAERILVLISAAQFRARQAGILVDTVQIADGRRETVVEFFEQVSRYGQPVELRVVALEDTFIAGPARLDLEAVQNGEVLFSTVNFSR